MCGLKLDAIAAELTVQNPSEEVAALLKKKRYMELLGEIRTQYFGHHRPLSGTYAGSLLQTHAVGAGGIIWFGCCRNDLVPAGINSPSRVSKILLKD